MPNASGIYQLSELQDRVFRLLKQVQQVINTSTGVESTITYPSQAFSTTDINQQINSSLVKLYNEVIVIALAYMRQYFEQVSSPAVITVPAELVNGTDYVSELTIPAITNVSFPASTNFARILQNAAIYDTAYVLAASRQMQLTDQIREGRDEWHKLLIDAATAAFKSAVYLSPSPTVDGSGRYNLTGLEDRVFRLLKQIQERPAVDSDGGMAVQTFPSQSFSVTDVDYRLNAALAKCYHEIIIIATGYMRQYFEQVGSPTVIAVPAALALTTDVISELTIPSIANYSFPTTTNFARIIQEVVIYEAAFSLAAARQIPITKEFNEERERWHRVLLDMATNTFKNVVYVAPTVTVDSSGRYNLGGLEDRVFRLLKQVQENAGATEGNVLSKTYPSQSFSVTDADQRINASLLKSYEEIIVVATGYLRQYFEQASAPLVITVPAALVNNTDVIQELSIPSLTNMSFPVPTTFARIIQEICVYDAVFALAAARQIPIADQFDKERERWHKTLMETVNNAFTNVVYKPATYAPDAFGRYALGEMEDRVFHLIKQIYDGLSAAGTGAEVSKTYPSQSFSTTDVDRQINASLARFYNEIAVITTQKLKEFIALSPEQFTQTFYVSVGANNPGPYGFPPNMVELRYLDWLPLGLSFATAKPSDWVPMLLMDDPLNRQMAMNGRAPTWQYANQGTAFILNESPTQSNSNGVRIKAATLAKLTLPAELVNPTDVIQEVALPSLPGVLWPSIQTFARLMQQACIYDAAYMLTASRQIKVSDQFEKERERWHQTLISTIENAFTNVVYTPPSLPMVNNRLPANTFSGRRRRAGARW